MNLHLPSDSKTDPGLVFGDRLNLSIFEATDKMPISEGHIYFAPAGYHLLIERDFSFGLTQDEPIHNSRPSIDVLFESAAIALGKEACGILLTGANADGAAGLKLMKETGSCVMIQDPKEAESTAMPLAALAIVKPDLVGSLLQILEKMIEFDTAGVV